jgi:hypothetical protein
VQNLCGSCISIEILKKKGWPFFSMEYWKREADLSFPNIVYLALKSNKHVLMNACNFLKKIILGKERSLLRHRIKRFRLWRGNIPILQSTAKRHVIRGSSFRELKESHLSS